MSLSLHIIRKGPIIGQHQDQPIHDSLIYDDHQAIRFSRVATVDQDGTIPLAQLADGEVVVSPGLVYTLDVRASHH